MRSAVQVGRGDIPLTMRNLSTISAAKLFAHPKEFRDAFNSEESGQVIARSQDVDVFLFLHKHGHPTEAQYQTQLCNLLHLQSPEHLFLRPGTPHREAYEQLLRARQILSARTDAGWTDCCYEDALDDLATEVEGRSWQTEYFNGIHLPPHSDDQLGSVIEQLDSVWTGTHVHTKLSANSTFFVFNDENDTYSMPLQNGRVVPHPTRMERRMDRANSGWDWDRPLLISREGCLIASISRTFVEVWKAGDPRLRATFTPQVEWPDRIKRAAFSPDSRHLAVGMSSGRIYFLDDSCHVRCEIGVEVYDQELDSLFWSADGHFLILGSFLGLRVLRTPPGIRFTS